MASTRSQVSTLQDDEPVAQVQEVVSGVMKGVGIDTALSGKKRVVTIHATEGHDEDVFVGLNGYPYQIRRGEPVEVPEEVYEILLNAKSDAITALRSGAATTRTSQRFAFTAA